VIIHWDGERPKARNKSTDVRYVVAVPILNPRKPSFIGQKVVVWGGRRRELAGRTGILEGIHRCKAKVRLVAGHQKVIEINVCYLHALDEENSSGVSEDCSVSATFRMPRSEVAEFWAGMRAGGEMTFVYYSTHLTIQNDDRDDEELHDEEENVDVPVTTTTYPKTTTVTANTVTATTVFE